MADWSELPNDLLVLIVRRINLIEDYLNFRTVCKSWCSVATRDNFSSDLPRVPWLMLAEDKDDNTYRRFFSLYNGMILKKSIPGARGRRCLECMGWLVTVGKAEGEISLLHPFSGVQIQLPHQIQFLLPYQNGTRYYISNKHFQPWSFIRKAVLSANPSHTCDYILMVIEGDFLFLDIWRPGDLSWTRLPFYNGKFNDVIYFNGNFYAVDFKGCIHVRDVVSELGNDVGSELGSRHIIELLEPHTDNKYYILESQGSLFVVEQCGVMLRCVRDDREGIPVALIQGEDDVEENISYACMTKDFLVWHIDVDACKATPTRDLGDRAFFLGANASLSVQASQFPGIKPNNIYFTDCLGAYLQFKEVGGLDMGVFNLADGSIQPHYDGVSLSRICPPIWITPNPC